MTDTVRTTCPYCGVGCGLLVTPGGERTVTVAGDPDHPANRGRLCVKGAALPETMGLEGRLLHPVVDGRRASWEDALDRVADGFRAAIRAHGPDAVAFYVSGQLLTEDYYVVNKLAKGFIGTANIDTNSRLCMSSSVAGHSRAFGSDTVPGCYEDLELADLIVLVGSNTAWCHPVLFQRIEAARAARPAMRLVVIDPRRTATAQEADLHLPLRPGSDVALFNGLLAFLAGRGVVDRDFVGRHTHGFAEAVAAAARDAAPADACDLDPALVTRFYEWFASTPRTITVYSQGVNQSSSGTDKVNAIINCHLATGRIGRPGAGPLSLTGQPNAMGGREVGGLAGTLAAHMDFTDDNVDRLRRFWGSPSVAARPGLKAVDLFQAVRNGRIKALWIMATNPAVSLCDSGLVREALGTCPLVVVSDAMEATDSTAFGHVLLPALTWAEKDGTVTNSERVISRQRRVLPAPGEARADWWIVSQVAARLGFGAAFPYRSAADIFREHCRLSGFENDGGRDFDLRGLTGVDYDGLVPVQWPVSAPGQETRRLFGNGGFFHPDGRARFVALRARPPRAAVSADWPLLLNTGRIRDQWHTMTRTGLSPRLSAHSPEPCITVHPADAAAFGLSDGAMARIESPLGGIVMTVVLDDAQRVGEVFAPMHWNDRFASAATVDRLIAGHTDPVSGQPELKAAPVRISALPVAWRGLLLSRSTPGTPDPGVVWSRSAGRGHVVTRLCGERPAADWLEWLRALCGPDGDWLHYEDRRQGIFRAARLLDGRPDVVFFVSPRGDAWALDWLGDLVRAGDLPPEGRAALLAGGVVRNNARGPVVCACHHVGRTAILDAVARQGASSLDDIGRLLGAGTGCGSCRPELRRLMAGARAAPVTAVPGTHD